MNIIINKIIHFNEIHLLIWQGKFILTVVEIGWSLEKCVSMFRIKIAISGNINSANKKIKAKKIN